MAHYLGCAARVDVPLVALDRKSVSFVDLFELVEFPDRLAAAVDRLAERDVDVSGASGGVEAEGEPVGVGAEGAKEVVRREEIGRAHV